MKNESIEENRFDHCSNVQATPMIKDNPRESLYSMKAKVMALAVFLFFLGMKAYGNGNEPEILPCHIAGPTELCIAIDGEWTTDYTEEEEAPDNATWNYEYSWSIEDNTAMAEWEDNADALQPDSPKARANKAGSFYVTLHIKRYYEYDDSNIYDDKEWWCKKYVHVLPKPSFTVTTTDETCCDDNDGTAMVNIDNPDEYTYHWDLGNGEHAYGQSVDSLDDGDQYMVTVSRKDCYKCDSTAKFEINKQPTFKIVCKDGTYWFPHPPHTNHDANPDLPTEPKWFLHRKKGLFSPWKAKLELGETDVSCHGAMDGSMKIKICEDFDQIRHRRKQFLIPGEDYDSFEFIWKDENGNELVDDNGAPLSKTDQIANLGPGQYCVTVLTPDVSGNNATCPMVKWFEIEEPKKLVWEPEVHHETCFEDDNGQIHLNIPDYLYTCYDNLTVKAHHEESEFLDDNWEDDYHNELPGTWNFTLCGEGNQDSICSIDTSLTLWEPEEIKFNANITNESCFETGDGKIVFAADPGYAAIYLVEEYDPNKNDKDDPHEIDLYGTDSTITPYDADKMYNAGMYTFHAEIPGGNPGDDACAVDTTIVIECPQRVLCSAENTNVSCRGEADAEISLDYFPLVADVGISMDGAEFQTYNESVTYSPGTYVLKVAIPDGNEEGYCISYDTVIVNENEGLAWNPTGINVECNGEENGGIDLQLSPTTITLGVLDLFINDIPIPVFSRTENLPFGAGDYNLRLVTPGGNPGEECELEAIVSINEPLPLDWNIECTHVSCYGEMDAKLSITHAPGMDITVNGEDYDPAAMYGAGKLHILGSNSGGCELDTCVYVYQPEPVILEVIKTDVTCHGSADATITVAALNHSVITISKDGGPATTFEPNESYGPGTYTIHCSQLCTNDNICESEVEITISEPELLNCTLNTDDPLCHGLWNLIESNVTGGSGDVTYEWAMSVEGQPEVGAQELLDKGWIFDANGAVMNYICGTVYDVKFTLTITDENGCIFDCYYTATPCSLGDYENPGGSESDNVTGLESFDNSSETNITSYPNPFVESATITFMVPQNTNGTLTIYSADGTPQDVIYDGELRANELYEQTIDADKYGNQVLIYILKTAEGIFHGKMMPSSKQP